MPSFILVEPFRQEILPILIEIGMIMVIYGFISLGYSQIRRPDIQQLIEKAKGLIFGYILVKGAYIFVMYINKVIDGISIK